MPASLLRHSALVADGPAVIRSSLPVVVVVVSDASVFKMAPVHVAYHFGAAFGDNNKVVGAAAAAAATVVAGYIKRRCLLTSKQS